MNKTTGVPAIKTSHKIRRPLLVAAIALSITPYLPLITSGADRLVFGRFIGLVGLQLILWQVVLGNRGITRLFTPDLLWMNKLHQLMGTYGYLLILLHPLLILTSYGLSLIWPPTFATTFDIGVRLGTTAVFLLTFIWVTSALFRKKLPWRWWKRLHFLGYILFPILFTHMLIVGSSMEQFWWVGTWLYGLLAVFLLAVLTRIAGWSCITKQRYAVIATEIVARDVTRFRLRPLGKRIMPSPGQFAYLQVQRFGEEHPFTVSHYNPETGEISFSIKAVGPYSRRLTTLQPDDIVSIDGPYGVFTEEMAMSGRSAVVIAGGIGITPFIRHLEAKSIKYLFWGCKSEADIAYRDEVEASRASIRYVLSAPEEHDSEYETGFITGDLVISALRQPLDAFDFYLCGPPPMMKVLHQQLLGHGVSPANIHQEKFSL